jgi:predicted metal-dependent peptidase
VRFIAVDTKVAMDITLHPGDEVPTRFPNTGGGTDFCSLFEMIAEEPEPPKVMIFFTDMEATYPEEEPSFPVIFMNTKNGSVVDPPFGVVLNYDVTNG